ncbi:hypothetical protein B9Z52_10650 [Limnohabitans sp. Jir72]|nr:hypothetical protein B9Z52_10650 [Limnohabitans sp. Jir72]
MQEVLQLVLRWQTHRLASSHYHQVAMQKSLLLQIQMENLRFLLEQSCQLLLKLHLRINSGLIMDI